MPRDNICMYMVHIVFMSVVMTVWGLWKCLLCSGRCCGILSLGVLKYGVCNTNKYCLFKVQYPMYIEIQVQWTI